MAEEYHNRVVAAHKGHGKVDIPLPLLNGRHRVYQPQGDVLVETELSESDLAGWAFRRPTPPPVGNGNGNGNGSANGESAEGDGAE